MADSFLQGLRRQELYGDAVAGARRLNDRMRRSELSEAAVVKAAQLGDQRACSVLEIQPSTIEIPLDIFRIIANDGKALWVRAATASLLATQQGPDIHPELKPFFDNSCQGAVHWLRNPGDSAALAKARVAGDQANDLSYLHRQDQGAIKLDTASLAAQAAGAEEDVLWSTWSCHALQRAEDFLVREAGQKETPARRLVLATVRLHLAHFFLGEVE